MSSHECEYLNSGVDLHVAELGDVYRVVAAVDCVLKISLVVFIIISLIILDKSDRLCAQLSLGVEPKMTLIYFRTNRLSSVNS